MLTVLPLSCPLCLTEPVWDDGCYSCTCEALQYIGCRWEFIVSEEPLELLTMAAHEPHGLMVTKGGGPPWHPWFVPEAQREQVVAEAIERARCRRATC